MNTRTRSLKTRNVIAAMMIAAVTACSGGGSSRTGTQSEEIQTPQASTEWTDNWDAHDLADHWSKRDIERLRRTLDIKQLPNYPRI